MRAIRALLFLIGALAVLTTGVAPAAAGPLNPPCHESTAQHGGSETPAPAPDKAMKATNCCVACVAAPSLRPPERAAPAAPRPTPAARPLALPAGEHPAPEPGPPRPALL